MKRILCLICAAVMALGLGACGLLSSNDAANTKVMETDVVTLDGIAVNDGYVAEEYESSSLRMVYLFLTVHPQDENLSFSSIGTFMTIDGNNEYTSENYPDDAVCKLTGSYYYSSYIEDVYMGESFHVAMAFKVPEADLADGRLVTFSDSDIPTMNELAVSTDDIQHFASAEELAEAMDPEGYAAVQELREDADPDTVALVKSQLNGYYYTFYVNNVSYELEFWADNNFEVRTSIGGAQSEPQQGTYSVKKGYIFCTYPSINHTVEIPYTITDGVVEIDAVAGFDIH